ncbi:MAG TPA: nucleotide exchange factor GrpE [Actinomycetales bacterium]|nr:nucleotide exchange factor GrpE [Actinomycetales bacterium]
MTDAHRQDDGRPAQGTDGGSEPPVVRDRRRIDPITGEVRDHPAEPPAAVDSVTEEAENEAAESAMASELLADLQRLQAEYVNYRKRVERDRDVARDLAVAGVLESLMPVLDDIQLAREHGDLDDGPFAAIADKLEGTLARFGMQRFGAPGEAFDPTVHEALMHTQGELGEGVDVTTVTQVMQPGYKAGERVLRAARVAVADPA